MPSLLTLLKLLVLFAPISSFVLTPRASILLAPLHRPHRLHLLPEPEKGDKIDWDADWQRVVRGEIKPTEPGISPPSDLEKTLRKAKASVQAKTKDIPKTLPKFEMLKQSEWQVSLGDRLSRRRGRALSSDRRFGRFRGWEVWRRATFSTPPYPLFTHVHASSGSVSSWSCRSGPPSSTPLLRTE